MSDQPERISLDPDAELVRADFDHPSIARIYDYHLGGNANFAVDREAADAMQQRWPRVRCYAQANRAFLARAVRTLVTDYGFEQFLDLGSGVPTVGNVHEIAHQVSSDARVAYVDWEAIAVHHARRLLTPTETRVSVTRAGRVRSRDRADQPGGDRAAGIHPARGGAGVRDPGDPAAGGPFSADGALPRRDRDRQRPGGLAHRPVGLHRPGMGRAARSHGRNLDAVRPARSSATSCPS